MNAFDCCTYTHTHRRRLHKIQSSRKSKIIRSVKSRSVATPQTETSPLGHDRMSEAHPHIHGSEASAQKQGNPQEPPFDLDLPYRQVTDNANLNEYVTETKTGEIPANGANGHGDYRLVTFLENDRENPKNWSKAYKWYCTMVVAFTCFVVAMNSAIITADIPGVKASFDVSEEVALVSVTVFVMGFGIGMSTQITIKQNYF